MNVAENKGDAPSPKVETYRSCGNCTMCCKLLGIEELAKPRDVWCGLCNKGQGCKVHGTPDKPPSCVEFQCLWTMQHENGSSIPERFRPDRARCVITPTVGGEDLSVYVDPGMPNAWKDGEFGQYLKTLAARGARLLITVGNKHYLLQKEKHATTKKDILTIRDGKPVVSEDGKQTDVLF